MGAFSKLSYVLRQILDSRPNWSKGTFPCTPTPTYAKPCPRFAVGLGRSWMLLSRWEESGWMGKESSSQACCIRQKSAPEHLTWDAAVQMETGSTSGRYFWSKLAGLGRGSGTQQGQGKSASVITELGVVKLPASFLRQLQAINNSTWNQWMKW